MREREGERKRERESLRERERSLSHSDMHVSLSHTPEYHSVHPCGAAYTISQKQENGQISKMGLRLVGFESSGPSGQETSVNIFNELCGAITICRE